MGPCLATVGESSRDNLISERAKGAAKASCGETVVQGVFGESVSGWSVSTGKERGKKKQESRKMSFGCADTDQMSTIRTRRPPDYSSNLST